MQYEKAAAGIRQNNGVVAWTKNPDWFVDQGVAGMNSAVLSGLGCTKSLELTGQCTSTGVTSHKAALPCDSFAEAPEDLVTVTLLLER